MTLTWSSSKQFAQKFLLFLKKHFVYKVKSVLHCLTFVDQDMAASCCYQRNKAHLFPRSTTFDVVYGSFQLWAWAATLILLVHTVRCQLPTDCRQVTEQLTDCRSLVGQHFSVFKKWKNCRPTVGLAICRPTVDRQSIVRRPTNFWWRCSSILPRCWTMCQWPLKETVLMVTFFLGASLRGDSSSPAPNQVLTKRRLQDLLHEIDPREQMDDDVEDVSWKE